MKETHEKHAEHAEGKGACCSSCFNPVCAKVHPYAYAIARILIGVIFFLHGATKFGWIGGKAMPLMSLMGLAGVIEVIVGILVIVGLWTRFVVPIAAIEMLVAYFMVHVPNGWNPLANYGEPALLFFAAFLILHIHGSGRCSLDRLMCKAKKE